MMKCEECEELLLGGADEVSSEDAVALSDHLKACPRCEAKFQKLTALDHLVKERFVPGCREDALRETVRRVKAEIAARQGSRVQVSRRSAFAWRIGLAAATLLMASAVCWLFLKETIGPFTLPKAPIAEADLVDRLVLGNLALSDAETPAERAAIFHEMAKCFYEDLLGAAAVGDGDEAAFALNNFEKLIRRGVMENARLLGRKEDKPLLTSLKSAFGDYSAGAKVLARKCSGDLRDYVERLIVVAQSAQQDTERILEGI